jgi:hypothetical protein
MQNALRMAQRAPDAFENGLHSRMGWAHANHVELIWGAPNLREVALIVMNRPCPGLGGVWKTQIPPGNEGGRRRRWTVAQSYFSEVYGDPNPLDPIRECLPQFPDASPYPRMQNACPNPKTHPMVTTRSEILFAPRKCKTIREGQNAS